MAAKVTTKLTKISPNGHTAYELLAFDSRPHRTAFPAAAATLTLRELLPPMRKCLGQLLCQEAMFGYVMDLDKV